MAVVNNLFCKVDYCVMDKNKSDIEEILNHYFFVHLLLISQNYPKYLSRSGLLFSIN